LDPIIRRLEWGTARVPLKSPYHLSFATMVEYGTVWTRSEDEHGNVGLGEAVPLPGYGWETLADVQEAVAKLVGGAVGLRRSELAGRCRALWPARPFAASAVMTALEFSDLLEETPKFGDFALNWPVAGNAPPDALRAQLLAGLDQGYGFIKVKVGKDLSSELANLPVLLKEWPERKFKVLFDANQGYDLDQALRFAKALAKIDSGRLLWFEQPLDREDWQGLADVCARSPVPIILDESVYSEEHVRRAARMGSHGVKLKLFKQCGPRHCLELAFLAKSLGLAVVFGNGVATDVGNLSEYLLLATADGLFSAPAESNGFNKLAASLLGGVLTERHGNLSLAVSKTELDVRIKAFIPEKL